MRSVDCKGSVVMGGGVNKITDGGVDGAVVVPVEVAMASAANRLADPNSKASSIVNCSQGLNGLFAVDIAKRRTIQIGALTLPTIELMQLLVELDVLHRKQLITTGELAAFIRMKPQTIAKWRSAGIADPPPAIHLGRQVRYDAEEVMSWIYRNRI
ncbi:MAG: helix-turn-helix domain-containing protein [Cellvibrionales bacterium]|nr:helix-turn-helix domain-containing protein [Cellvibrionales bacterium]